MRFPIRRVPAGRRRAPARGFTLVELMITLTVLALVVTALMAVMYAASRSRTATVNRIESTQAARAALDMITRDLRSAGYGADAYSLPPQLPIAYVDSLEVLLCANLDPYPDTTLVSNGPRAYDPAGAPRPRPLDGTAWQPPVNEASGAELIRWTLDVNNDGAVDVADMAGTPAMRTRNPNDYVLVRQVYGDSTGNMAGNNGGQQMLVALVRRPGNDGTPPMFRVYFENSTTPWDWSNGPVPVSRLDDIERIEVNITAASSKPDARGQYASTHLTTEVNSMRNVPDFGDDLYTVDGYVFSDDTPNGTRDVGEPGIGGVQVRLGNAYVAVTNASGYFNFRAVEGTYTLRHTPPPNFTVVTSPDSFVVTVAPGGSYSFADRPRPGGWVSVQVYDDQDADGSWDAGEPPLPGVRLTSMPVNDYGFTNAAGAETLFADVGSYTVTATPPDSFAASTPNPVTGTMVDGGTASHVFGLTRAEVGTISGTVFNDLDRDGQFDSGEVGKPDVWVGVSPDGGVTVLGFAITDASGAYKITVPANQPPATTPYYVYIVVPAGFFPTSSASRGPLFISANENLTQKDFGLTGFQKIQLSAQRVLSLGSGDLVEKDWSGSVPTRRAGDADLVLGADNLGTDQVSIWYNQYNLSPLFRDLRDQSRSAPQAVTCLSVAAMDEGSASLQGTRLDVVTGTRYSPSGNLHVWFTQNSSGNEGTLATIPSRSYFTLDNGDAQALITADIAGATALPDARDIIVGTKSPTAWQGMLEIWASTGGSAPSYVRIEAYSTGEVSSLALADLDLDGVDDLIVGTRTGTYSGAIHLLRGMGKMASPRYQYMTSLWASIDWINSVVAVDVDADGDRDLVAGTTRGPAIGKLLYYRNDTPASFGFSHRRTSNAPGPIQCLAVGDFGGDPSRMDVAAGWRADAASFVGGLRIFYTDTSSIPDDGTDPTPPSAKDPGIVNWVAALTVNNFNWGLYPAWSGTPLTDLAVGVKSTATDGAIWVLVR